LDEVHVFAPDCEYVSVTVVTMDIQEGSVNDNPGVLERHHVVNVNVGGGSPGCAVEGGDPFA
jgi:hypothetical protein